jgi:hypothetical protein
MRGEIIGIIVRNIENWVLAALGLLGSVLLVQTFGYSFGAALFPRLVTTVLAALCFFRLGANIARACGGRSAKGEGIEEPSAGLPWYLTLLMSVLYLAVIYLIGFIFATALFLLVFPLAASYRRWVIVSVVAFAIAVLSELTFDVLLQMQLPDGILFNLLKH